MALGLSCNGIYNIKAGGINIPDKSQHLMLDLNRSLKFPIWHKIAERQGIIFNKNRYRIILLYKNILSNGQLPILLAQAGPAKCQKKMFCVSTGG